MPVDPSQYYEKASGGKASSSNPFSEEEQPKRSRLALVPFDQIKPSIARN